MASLFKQPSLQTLNSVLASSLQQWRGIRVKVLNGKLDQALQIMQRKMQTSGMERLLKNHETRHIKNSEKRVLARKSLERKIQAQDLSRKLKSILTKKVRGVTTAPTSLLALLMCVPMCLFGFGLIRVKHFNLLGSYAVVLCLFCLRKENDMM
ncbi:hypothetical protein KSS87_015183 [Heliosperma pusillum]|nr:hypothetical protein KSS87_015183 [Heliosperma pusillum]